MTPIPGCLSANLLTAVLLFVPCWTTSLLSSSLLKQPLIILSAYPLEQSAFESHYIASGCLYPRWQKKQKAAHPILVISASGLGGSLPARGASVCGFQNKSPCTFFPTPISLGDVVQDSIFIIILVLLIVLKSGSISFAYSLERVAIHGIRIIF